MEFLADSLLTLDISQICLTSYEVQVISQMKAFLYEYVMKQQES